MAPFTTSVIHIVFFQIEGLSKLTDLHLSQNSIECLPPSIGKLSKLTIFKIDQNRLSTLEESIGRYVSFGTRQYCAC